MSARGRDKSYRRGHDVKDSERDFLREQEQAASGLQSYFTNCMAPTPLLAKAPEAEKPLAVPHIGSIAAQEVEVSPPTRESTPDPLPNKRTTRRTNDNGKALHAFVTCPRSKVSIRHHHHPGFDCRAAVSLGVNIAPNKKSRAAKRHGD